MHYNQYSEVPGSSQTTRQLQDLADAVQQLHVQDLETEETWLIPVYVFLN